MKPDERFREAGERGIKLGEPFREAGVGCNVYIVEDHGRVRETLRELLDSEPDLSVCGAAGSAEDALEDLEQSDADLLLIDVSLPAMTGIDLARLVRERYPTIRCLMYSGFAGASYVERALEAGASGYVLKDDPDELWTAIREVMGGGQYVSKRF